LRLQGNMSATSWGNHGKKLSLDLIKINNLLEKNTAISKNLG
jgi:hypothetical protein